MNETRVKLPNFIASTAPKGTHFCLCGRVVSQDSKGYWAHNNTAGDCRLAVNWNTCN